MKIDKKKPLHWIRLSLFGINVVCAIALRPFFRRRGPRRHVILYGHKLAGNLLAIQRYLETSGQTDIQAWFLTMDKDYYQKLIASGVTSALATSPSGLRLLCQADAVISDHGLHALAPMLLWSNIKFFDVWHGIPFKGFDAGDFRLQHRYNEVWVASQLMAKMYVERFGFDAKKIKVTGYARTDRLVRQDEDVTAIKRSLDLDGPDVGKIILFAPTWKQDAHKRSIYPFGTDEQAFLQPLSELAQRNGCTIVMRTHLNSGVVACDAWGHIVQRPFADYPDTEALLLVSDILVCDWSSIAFDWLLLERSTIFLDVEPPFAKGFSLDASFRWGEIVSDMNGLLHLLECRLRTPADYHAHCHTHAMQMHQAVYDDCADGAATKRCVRRLKLGLLP